MPERFKVVRIPYKVLVYHTIQVLGFTFFTFILCKSALKLHCVSLNNKSPFTRHFYSDLLEFVKQKKLATE